MFNLRTQRCILAFLPKLLTDNLGLDQLSLAVILLKLKKKKKQKRDGEEETHFLFATTAVGSLDQFVI